MNPHAERSATLLARVDQLDPQQTRDALRAALLGFGELRRDHDPDSVVEHTLEAVKRSMDAPAVPSWRDQRMGPRPSSLRAS